MQPGGTQMAFLEVSDAAWELLLTLIDNDLGRKRTLIKPEMLEAFRELSRLGLAESTKSADWPEYWSAKATDAGRYFTGHAMGR